MCGIMIGAKEDIYSTLVNQKDRGLDSLGIIDFQSKKIEMGLYDNLFAYKGFIEGAVESNGELCFMHHRKASIGGVSMDNSHPFKGDKFILAQNGTSREFFTAEAGNYGKETDSETILSYLEDRCDTLEECIVELDGIEAILGIIFIFHKDRTLIYSDGMRESYIEIEDYLNEDKEIVYSQLISLTNYKPSLSYGYNNGFQLIINSVSGEVYHEWTYDSSFNFDFFSVTKKSKKTKKIFDEYGVSGKPTIILKKNNSPFQTKVKEEEENKKTQITCSKFIENIIEINSSIDVSSLKTHKDIDNIFDKGGYDIYRRFNDKSQLLIKNLILILLSDKGQYQRIETAIDDIHGKYLQENEDLTESTMLIQFKYLDNTLYNFNIIRHLRIILQCDYFDLLDYFEIITYIFSNHQQASFDDYSEYYNREYQSAESLNQMKKIYHYGEFVTGKSNIKPAIIFDCTLGNPKQ